MRQLLVDMLQDGGRQADTARPGQRLDAGGDVHAVAEQVARLDHDVADMDADAELEPAVGRELVVGLGEPLLRRHGALDGIHGAGELGQQAVAGGVGDPTAMAGDELGQHARDAR